MEKVYTCHGFTSLLKNSVLCPDRGILRFTRVCQLGALLFLFLLVLSGGAFLTQRVCAQEKKSLDMESRSVEKAIDGKSVSSQEEEKASKTEGSSSFEGGKSPVAQLEGLLRSFHKAGFGFSGSYSYSRRLIEISEGENTDSSAFSYSLSYKKLKPWSASSSITFFNDRDIVEDERRQLFLSSAGLSFSRAPLKRGELSFRPSIKLRLPVGRYDWVSESLYLGIRASLGMPLPQSWMPKKASGSLGVGVSKNFHKFNTRLGGGPNTEWSAGLSGSLSYPLGKYVSFGLSGSYGIALTYTPEANEFFSLGQSISASYKNLGFSVGHSLNSSVYAPDGVNYNVRIFDRDYSNIFANLSVTL